MRKSISMFTVIVIAIFIAGSCGTANAGQSFSSNWANSTLSKEACVKEARSVMTNAQFTGIAQGASSVSGTRGAYTALIRLIPEKSIVFFCVIGPDPKECDRFTNFLKSKGLW